MRNRAYHLTAYAAVISAAGFMLRWLQNIRIIDPETGLATSGMPISYVVAGLIVLAAASFAGIAFYLRRFDAPCDPEMALTGKTLIHTAISIIPALILAAAGVMLLAQAASDKNILILIFGAATFIGAVSVLGLVTGMRRPDKAGARRLWSGLLILFGGLWLITIYKTAATDPVLWRFAVEILAICVSLLAFYHVAGYFYGQPTPYVSIFLCQTGAFLCIMSAIDDHSTAENLCFIAVALLLLIWSYTIIANLGKQPESETPASEDAPQET